MIKDITPCLLLSLFLTPFCTYAQPSEQDIIQKAFAHQQRGFVELEHQELGDKVRLQWAGLPHRDANNVLTMPNGLQLSYGEIVYLGADLVGDTSCSISTVAPKKRKRCFQRQFNALAEENSPHHCHSPITRIPVYREYFQQLAIDIANANANGQDTASFYQENSQTLIDTLNRLSCGGSAISPLFPFGQFIKLAERNFDHFPPDAITAYETGHGAAIESAVQAHQYYQQNALEEAEKSLQIAYAQNAYANHYLTDAMSSGHMRVPRRAIDQQVYLPAVLKLLIANLMHDEDNIAGLNVHNRLGQHWRAYGDGMLHQAEAEPHREILLDLMQMSADEVFLAFSTGQAPEVYKELDLLPIYDELWQNGNHAPLFKVKKGRLLKRKSNFDREDFRYTRWWNALVTLIEFHWHS
ncbi:MAG: phospholipase [Legionellaceae bacterium]|nr:phospholipase [Legionellaceae bacterium]